MKILVILTGGTIAGTVSDNIINVNNGSQYKIIDMYNNSNSENDIEFTVLSPLNILSENICLSDFETLIHCLNEQALDAYSGVIITHGSDTIPYTAAVLDLYFNSVNIPIMLVCSNYELCDKRSNGFENFCSAIGAIKSAELSGVFAVYKNRNNKFYIYEGKNLLEADSYFDDFFGFGGAFATVENDKITKLRPIVKSKAFKYKKEFQFSNRVALIKVYPGIDYSSFNFSQNTKAVLLEFYHSATASVCKENNVVPFIKKCCQNNLDVYFCSMKKNGGVYMSCAEILTSGAKPIYDSSVYSAYANLLLKYNAI